MDFEAVIGLEIHIKLKTESKMFCGCRNDVFNMQPNQAVCPICMGFPGTLPVINKKAVEYGTILALALHCTIAEHTKFDRKNYFYPDLPKGYQISQYDIPLSQKGYVEFLGDGAIKKINITRLHLEEDSGKLVHEGEKTYVDFNRAGTPLAEIVTEPDFRTEKEVSCFLRELQQIARYLKVSNADMEKGEMRCDVNVSVRPKGEEKFGTKVELKNMNSFSAIEKAVKYEIERQIQCRNNGESIIHETRGWDDKKGISLSQRVKEELHDYRYFPEPDLPPLLLNKKFVQELQRTLPELPTEKRLRYQKEYNLKEDDARMLATDKSLSDFFEETAKLSKDPVKSANVILSILLAHINEDAKTIDAIDVKPQDIAKLIIMVQAGELSMSALKIVLEELYYKGGSIEKIIEQKGLKQQSDAGEIEKICKEVLDENALLVEQYMSGKTKVFGSFVGQVMKKSGGKVNPSVASEILQRLLK